ncbi:MAG: hypothetical protein SRB2_01822 [Desulfobacteraceae bacterium Eth-SRB2]|nr:MAG: hypothetical protein SRB2_01822 [Desulfobacteraceae bacterium Eth-SRB2]
MKGALNGASPLDDLFTGLDDSDIHVLLLRQYPKELRLMQLSTYDYPQLCMSMRFVFYDNHKEILVLLLGVVQKFPKLNQINLCVYLTMRCFEEIGDRGAVKGFTFRLHSEVFFFYD